MTGYRPVIGNEHWLRSEIMKARRSADEAKSLVAQLSGKIGTTTPYLLVSPTAQQAVTGADQVLLPSAPVAEHSANSDDYFTWSSGVITIKRVGMYHVSARSQSVTGSGAIVQAITLNGAPDSNDIDTAWASLNASYGTLLKLYANRPLAENDTLRFVSHAGAYGTFVGAPGQAAGEFFIRYIGELGS